MKKIGVYSVLTVSAFGLLLGLSPLKAHATSTVKMDFVATGGAYSGGTATYPYYFDIGTSKVEVPLLCVSYQDTIQIGETWTADVYAIGAGGANTQSVTGLTLTEQEEDAYLDSVILGKGASTTTISEAQWADWIVSDSSLDSTSALDKLGLNNVNGVNEVSGILAEYASAQNFVATNTLTSDAKFYDAYQLYVPVPGSQSPWCDGTPQTFIGPAVPEPSSLILFGSGLLTAAGALYRRKRYSA